MTTIGSTTTNATAPSKTKLPAPSQTKSSTSVPADALTAPSPVGDEKTKHTGWRQNVVDAHLLPDNCQEFLDKYSDRGRVSRVGTILLKSPVGEPVPYELCPLRIRRIIRMVTKDGDLRRDMFKTNVSYKTAMCNLFINGYLDVIPVKLIAQRKKRIAAVTHWSKENPDKMKQYSKNALAYRQKWARQHRDRFKKNE